MPRTADPTVPTAPLWRYLEHTHDDVDMSLAEVGNLLNVDPRTVCRWRTSGVMSVFAADKAAIHIGSHLYIIWTEGELNGME